MELIAATKRLSALAQDSRLTVFRLLVRAGRDGIAAGEIARTLGTIGAQLRGVRTVGDLQAGIELSERFLAGESAGVGAATDPDEGHAEGGV